MATRHTVGPLSTYSQANCPGRSASNWNRSGKGSWSLIRMNVSPDSIASKVRKIVGCFSRGGMTRTSNSLAALLDSDISALLVSECSTISRPDSRAARRRALCATDHDARQRIVLTDHLVDEPSRLELGQQELRDPH